VKTSAGLRYE
jgi:hypothetical protein